MLDILTEPFSRFIGAIFVWTLGIVHDHGLALIVLSIVVNIILSLFIILLTKLRRKRSKLNYK
ncbi:hypothetical protein ERIN107935_05160 [Erysipelothrix inopinata]